MRASGGIEMNKLLTISIAAYNVESTIDECLKSFLSMKHFDELEILVVNDGSKDNTVPIVKKYEARYPSVIKLVNKENGGHGSTINKSLELASGKYYRVIDGDDWVDPSDLDRLLEHLRDSDSDLIVEDYRCVYTNTTELVSHRKYFTTNKKYIFSEIYPLLKQKNIVFSMHESTIDTQRLRDVKTHISEKCFYADTDFIYFVGLAVRTIEFSNTCVYQYRLDRPGQSMSSEGVYKHAEDIFRIELGLLSRYERDSANIEKERAQYLFSIIEGRYNYIFDWYIKLIKRSDKDNLLSNFISSSEKNFPIFMRQVKLTRLGRIIKIYPKVFIPLLRFIYNSYAWNALKKLRA